MQLSFARDQVTAWRQEVLGQRWLQTGRGAEVPAAPSTGPPSLRLGSVLPNPVGSTSRLPVVDSSVTFLYSFMCKSGGKERMSFPITL